MRKIIISILTLFLIAFLFFAGTRGRFTFFSISPQYDDVDVPVVNEGEEVLFYGYKYSNNSNIIVSTEPEIHCKWKSTNDDDGWKVCEAIFDVENFGEDFGEIVNPEINFDFENADNIRNVELSYSQSFTVEEFSEDGEESTDSIFTGRAVFENDDRINRRKFRRFKPIPADLSSDISESENLENGAEIGLQNTNNDTNYSEVSPEENFSVGEIENFSEDIIDEYSENYSNNESAPELHGQNVTFEENLSGNQSGFSFVTGLSLEDSFEIDSSRPFAIRITFEIPKYESNRFDFKIEEGDFFAEIDPDVSSCGDLTDAGEYSVNQSLTSTGTCFYISAEEITLNCQGNILTFGTSGEESYGIKVLNDGATIQNCGIFSGNSSGTEYGIFLDTVNNVEINSNQIIVEGIEAYGIYTQSSDSVSIINNTINSTADSGTGITIDFQGDYVVYGNLVNTEGSLIHSFYNENGDGLNLTGNFFRTSGNEANGLYLTATTDSVFNNNTVLTLGDSAYGFFLDFNSALNEIGENNVSTYGNESHGLYLDNNCPNNILFGNSVLTFGSQSIGIDVSSTAVNLSNNRIVTRGYQSWGIYLENEIFDDNIYGGSILTYGSEGHGLKVGDNAKNASLIGVDIRTLNSSAYSVYLDGGYLNFTVSDSSFESSYSGTSEIFIGNGISGGFWNFTNVSFSNLTWPEGVNLELNVWNYLYLKTNYSNGTFVGEANVSLYDYFGEIKFNELSDENGDLPQHLLLSYIKTNSTGAIYYYDFVANASMSNWEQNISQSISLPFSKLVGLTFVGTEPVIQNSGSLSGSSGGSGASSLGASSNDAAVLESASEEEGQKIAPRENLFDINLDLVEEEVSGELLARIGLVNLGLPGETKVALQYIVSDMMGNVFIEDEEFVSLETQTQFIKEIDVSDLDEGKYRLIIDLVYEGQREPARTETNFEVLRAVSLSPSEPKWIFLTLVTVIALITVSLVVKKLKSRSKSKFWEEG